MTKNITDYADAHDTINTIIDSNLPLDWVSLEQFGKLIGYPSDRLYHAKAKWPEFVVWQKVGGKLYFSLRGWNQWLTQEGCRKALEYEAQASKLISQSAVSGTTLRCRRQQRRQTSAKRESYELI